MARNFIQNKADVTQYYVNRAKKEDEKSKLHIKHVQCSLIIDFDQLLYRRSIQSDRHASCQSACTSWQINGQSASEE
jgi:septation ring formation regulator EzrA